MDISKFATLIITFIIVFAAAFYSINAIWPTTNSVNPLNVISGKYASDLSKTSTVATSDQFSTPFFQSSGGTLVLYVYLTSVQRAASTQYVTLAGVPNCIGLQVAGSAARISVFTQNAGSGQIQSEFIELPRIPEQKWIQVAILREGRRFDVVYNDKIVASQRLKYTPVIQIAGLVVGAQGLTGLVGGVRVAARRLTIQEIQQEHAQTSDTRGKPYIGTQLAPPPIPVCSGSSCPSTTSPPNNTLQYWSSPYM